MVRAKSTVEIERPLEEVFAFVADQSNEPKWHTDILRVDPQGPIELGSRVRWVVRFMGENQYLNDVTAFEPGRRIEMAALEGPLKPTVTHSFEEVDGRTRYTRHVRIPLQGMFRLVGPVMRATGAAHRRNARFARNLKDLLER
ncbi:MAG: SRPBCC family protein [Actinobacteria bacterium]|nr:SRPBCC family protein [Actinomycetota bacterium]